MPYKRISALIFGMMVMLLLSACALPDSLLPASGNPVEVTFEITIQPEVFSPEAEITVYIWNGEQLKRSEQTSNCTVSYDVETGEETTDCPEGVVFQEAKPEQFSFPASQVGEKITVTSRSLRMGEKYMLQVGGLGSDNCNQTSAGVEGTVRSKTIKVDNLQWMSTLMACPEEAN